MQNNESIQKMFWQDVNHHIIANGFWNLALVHCVRILVQIIYLCHPSSLVPSRAQQWFWALLLSWAVLAPALPSKTDLSFQVNKTAGRSCRQGFEGEGKKRVCFPVHTLFFKQEWELQRESSQSPSENEWKGCSQRSPDIAYIFFTMRFESQGWKSLPQPPLPPRDGAVPIIQSQLHPSGFFFPSQCFPAVPPMNQDVHDH